MAESTKNISQFKKRKFEDINETITSMSNFNISSKDEEPVGTRYHEVFNICSETSEDPRAVCNQFFPIHGEIETIPPFNYYDENSISQIQIPIIYQYSHLLLKDTHLWILGDTDIAMVSDYTINEGCISLKSSLVLIDTNTHLCKHCSSLTCLHAQAYEICYFNYNDSFNNIKVSAFKNTQYFTLSRSCIIIQELDVFHIYLLRANKWFCDTCDKLCKLKSTAEKIICSIEPYEMETIPSKTNYQTISSTPIPFSLNERQAKIYSEQLSNGINLPNNLVPELDICKNGYKLDASNFKLNKGIILYLENDVVELKDHQVYSYYCSGPCHCKVGFDGKNFLLMNLNNRYLIHYSLLYEYSELMTHSKNPLFSYLSAKNSKIERMGRKLKYKYHVFQHAWNSYLRQIDINYNHNFRCPTCQQNPPIIILDGIAMGTTKKLPEPKSCTDDTQIFKIIPLEQRIYVPNVDTRKKLQEYSEFGIHYSKFTTMLHDIQPEFANYIKYSSTFQSSKSYSNIDRVNINPNYPLVAEVILLLSRTESLLAITHLSSLTTNQRTLLGELCLKKSADISSLEAIYRKIYFIKNLINSLNHEIDLQTNLITIHDNVADILSSILKQIQALVRKPTRKPIENRISDEIDYFNYFPSLQTNLKIPLYEDNNNKETIYQCTKIYPKHRRFSPGLLVMACQHRYCYGFEVMSARESTVLVFNMLMRKFRTMPEVIIYDNACNLHATCIMRDPFLFRNTTFLIDRFHSRNHICNPTFSMKYCETEEMGNINSQICEQLFSSLRRIATQVAYMRIETIFFNTRYFLACWNKSLQKINK